MSLTILQMAPLEIIDYPEIPIFYANLDKDECAIVGCFDNYDRENLLGIIIIAYQLMNREYANVRYVWFADGVDEEKLYMDMMKRLRSLLHHMGVKYLVFRSFSGEQAIEGFITPQRMSGLGYEEVPVRLYTGGWDLASVYDTEFLSHRAVQEQLNENIVGFSSFSREKRKILMRKLGAADQPEYLGPTLESPYNRIYMHDNKPLCSIMIEVPLPNAVAVSDAWVMKGAKSQSVLENTIAAALGLAVSGMGMSTAVLACFKEKAEMVIIEDLLGKSEATLKSQIFVARLN